MKIVQVITGDIVNSTSMTIEQRNQIRLAFDFLSQNSTDKYEYFIRGDGFQVLSQKPNALRESLLIKTYLYAKTEAKAKISIGIGGISYESERVSDSDGEAFWLSGRALDELKNKSELLTISMADEDKKAEWELNCLVLDFLEKTQTRNQAEAIYWLLNNKTQQEIASILSISQPSVNNRIKNSGWNIIEKMLKRFQNV